MGILLLSSFHPSLFPFFSLFPLSPLSSCFDHRAPPRPLPSWPPPTRPPPPPTTPQRCHSLQHLLNAVWPAYPVLPGCTPVYLGKCLKCRYLPRYYQGHGFFCQKMVNLVKKWSKIVNFFLQLVKNIIKWSKWSKMVKNCQE